MPVKTDQLTLESSLELLDGIGPKRAELLGNLGIRSVGDLVYHLPRDYQDRRDITPMADAEEGALVTVEGEVLAARNVRMRGRMSMAVVTIGDESGRMTATFFGRGFLARTVFRPGVRGFFTGTVGSYKGRALKNPEYELIGEEEDDLLNTGCIVPIYRLTEKVTQRMLRKWIHTALGAVEDLLEERLPAHLVARDGWPPVSEAIRSVHYPETLEVAQLARRRFAYEELLGMQVGLLRRRAARLAEERGHEHTINGPTLKALGRTLPFVLTVSQDRVISEILGDMASARPMLRLVQGDVGCGKTVVALHAIAAPCWARAPWRC